MGRSSTRARNKIQRPTTAGAGDAPAGHAAQACRIVAIGGSAGGLEAVTSLLRGLPDAPGLAFVFIQHLTPNVESSLPAILAKATSLKVEAAQDGTPVQPNYLYVAKPGTAVHIVNKRLHVEKQVFPRVEPRAIDDLLLSLAADEDGHGVGVLLSGTGTDGVQGLKALKASGAITIVQAPETAAFDGLPRAAIQEGCVDLVLDPGEIGAELGRLAKIGVKPLVATLAAPESADDLLTVLELVRKRTGLDLSGYKAPALLRRISRRMLLRGVNDFASYCELLRVKPEEIDALKGDLLIHVTEFFREPSAFDALKTQVFPALLSHRSPSGPLRLWVAGCSTGEEVYSLLIALSEFLEERKQTVPIQLFGTDISDQAIQHARAGLYSATSLAGISSARLRRYFVKRDGSYQISKELRDLCVFSTHNLAADPPFSKVDLITCRNVLIYLGPPLQQKLISTFHFALRPTGYLLLGSAESIGAGAELFSVIDKKERIFRKKSGAIFRLLQTELRNASAAAEHERPPPGTAVAPEAETAANQYLLDRYAPAAIVADANLDVLCFRGPTGKYLHPSSGPASLQLLRLLPEDLALEVRALVSKAKKTRRSARIDGLAVHGAPSDETLSIEVRELPLARGANTFLLIFEEAVSGRSAPRPRRPAKRKGGRRRVDDLERELAAARRRLQIIFEEQENSTQEMRALNEETQSTNEELQSTNEELETAKEELQATNEELTTLNDELQSRNSELTSANNDLINLLANVNLAILMVDGALRVRRFTPLAQGVLSIIPGDVGRPIGDLRPKLTIADLDGRIARVIESLEPEESVVKDRSGRSFLLRIRPYRTVDNRIDGAVLTLIDVAPEKGVAPAQG